MKKFLSLFGLCLLAACDTAEQGEPSQATAMAVTVVQPQKVRFEPELQLHGTIIAKERIEIGTPLQGLQILSVQGEVGLRVKKGQVLATLEQSGVQAQFQQHSAQLAKAKANLNAQQAALKEAESTLKRYRTLMKSDSISRQEWESQQTKVSSIQSAVKAANAEIAEIQAQLANSRSQRNKAEVLAPTDGIILSRNAKVGSLTDSNALFTLAKEGVVEVQVEANLAEITKLQQGQAVKIYLANHTVLDGKIRLIPQEMDENSRLGKVIIRLDQPHFFPLGSYVDVRVKLAHSQSVWTLPLSALAIGTSNQAIVMAVNEENQTYRHVVQIGEIHQGQVEIVAGLQGTERIVKQAAAFIDEGDYILPQLAQGDEK